MIASDTAANAALDACYGDEHASTWPSSFEFVLFAGDPLVDGVELTGGSYAAVTLSNDTATFPDASGRAKTNGVDIVGPLSTDAYDAVGTHWATRSGGVLWDAGELTTEVDVLAAGSRYRIPAGSLAIRYP